jgi:hypothetical protein
MPKVPLELALFKAIWFRKTSERGRSELSKGGDYGGSPIRGIVFDAGRSTINVPGPKRAERHGDSRSADQSVCTGLSPDSTAYDIPKSARIYELPRVAIEGNGQDVFVVQSPFRGVCPDPRVSTQRPKFVSPTKRV